MKKVLYDLRFGKNLVSFVLYPYTEGAKDSCNFIPSILLDASHFNKYLEKKIFECQRNAGGQTDGFLLYMSLTVSYSTVVLYIRNHEDLGFSGQKYHPKTQKLTSEYHPGVG